MKTSIDILIINNCPSFYKINLYNKLAEKCNIHVVFIAMTNQVVINNTFRKDIKFSYELLSSCQIEKRNRWKSVLKLFYINFQYKYKKIIYGGYDDLEERLLIWFSPKRKNCLQFESSILESKITGPIAIIKKIIFNRFSVVLPSGKLQAAVFETLGYKGNVIETKGVGLFQKNATNKKNLLVDKNNFKYIFIGRLIPVKNLEFLIHVFNQTNKLLTIVGTGELEVKLKKQANSNIKFVGFIPNTIINELYNSHDIFILPSISETWGLVVEEAIYFGLPVLVSEAVGCQEEMVSNPNTGIVFSPTDEKSLISAMEKLEEDITMYRQNCSIFDFEKRDKEQINAYIKLLSL